MRLKKKKAKIALEKYFLKNKCCQVTENLLLFTDTLKGKCFITIFRSCPCRNSPEQSRKLPTWVGISNLYIYTFYSSTFLMQDSTCGNVETVIYYHDKETQNLKMEHQLKQI